MNKHENCPFEKEKETFFDSRLLKIAGIIYGIASPWVIWVTVSIFTSNSDMALVRQKQEVIIEMKQAIDNIQKDVNKISIDMAIIKAKEQYKEQK
jgi:hypothetical protein